MNRRKSYRLLVLMILCVGFLGSALVGFYSSYENWYALEAQWKRYSYGFATFYGGFILVSVIALSIWHLFKLRSSSPEGVLPNYRSN